MSIRAADNHDLPAITTVVATVLREYDLLTDRGNLDADLNDIDAAYTDRGGHFAVLEHDGAIIGTVGLYPVDTETCELRKMYLLARHRGKGLGRQLLDHALHQARTRGFRRVTLETAPRLKDAIALYRKYGFTPTTRPKHAPSTSCDLAFELILENQ